MSPLDSGPVRLAIVLSHPTQYYSPWFRWLRVHGGICFRVFYLWEFGVTQHHDREFDRVFKWDVDLLSGYEHEFVPNTARDPGTHHFGGLRNPALPRRLAAWRPEAVLMFGYKWHAHLRALAWARLRSVPLIFRGDSHFLARRLPAWPARLAMRAVYAQFAAVTYVGAANRDYFVALGVPLRRLYFAPHAVDAERFNAAREECRGALALRAQLGIAPGTRVVLFAGKLIPIKRPGALLEAFLALAPRDTVLVFSGDGAEKPALVEHAAHAPANTVLFLPFANQSEMPARYLLADLLVLPSASETWGLVVNEAMHLGVPALVSRSVGCQRDLVTDGETGWVFDGNEPQSLRTKLGDALTQLGTPEARERIRRAVLGRIANYTYAQATTGLRAAIAAATARPDA